MNTLRYTLLSDGSSDQALIPILTWLLRQYLPGWAIQEAWADLRRLPAPPRMLAERIAMSVSLYPCDLLFIHRDAESASLTARWREIDRAIKASERLSAIPPVICVIPVRMQEAWLFFDEMALRWAAGNPHGRHPLPLPRIGDLEQLTDPKRLLHDLLHQASGLQGRRLKALDVRFRARRVAEYAEDFAPLRQLPAFAALEASLETLTKSQGWASS